VSRSLIAAPYGKPVLSESEKVEMPANGRWKKQFKLKCPATGPCRVVAETRTEYGLSSTGKGFGSRRFSAVPTGLR